MIEFIGKFFWTTRTFSYSLLLFYFFLTFSTTAEYDSRDVGNISNDDRTQDNDFRSCTEGKCIKRTKQEISSGMWFGPRLGKRRKLESQTEMDTTELERNLVANILDGTRWDILTVPGNKRRITEIKFNNQEEQVNNADDQVLSKLILSDDTKYARKDDPFSLPIKRGNGRVPWTISSRFPHRPRFPAMF